MVVCFWGNVGGPEQIGILSLMSCLLGSGCMTDFGILFPRA